MKIKLVTRDVYLHELSKASFIQRAYFELSNHWNTDWGRLVPNSNPLYWCVMDVLKIIYAPILILIIWPLLIFPVAMHETAKLKSKYVGDEHYGVFIRRAKWLEVE